MSWILLIPSFPLFDIFSGSVSLPPLSILSPAPALEVPALNIPRWDDSNAPSLAALLEWNSRVGVRRDVWALVSTMEVRCSVCRLVRSAPAHRRHLVGGNCPLFL
jgi:hypothetical protein